MWVTTHTNHILPSLFLVPFKLTRFRRGIKKSWVTSRFIFSATSTRQTTLRRCKYKLQLSNLIIVTRLQLLSTLSRRLDIVMYSNLVIVIGFCRPESSHWSERHRRAPATVPVHRTIRSFLHSKFPDGDSNLAISPTYSYHVHKFTTWPNLT